VGQGFNLVDGAKCWHTGDPDSNPWQGRNLYIWMCTPSAVSILGVDMYVI
jgi:hypothetical protein